ncbi:MAG: CDGSH iron-sulfur domain-containing protein [Leptospiraceae bacterium]|nr:CDGSH iron-sulfur domain-containing protein [Leptospiraceae bacterium]
MKPVMCQIAQTETVYFCGCKHTKNPPFCDGTHNSL